MAFYVNCFVGGNDEKEKLDDWGVNDFYPSDVEPSRMLSRCGD